MLKLIKKLTGIEKREQQRAYEQQKVDFVYHLVIGLARMEGYHPSRVAKSASEIEKNLVYLNELFKAEKEA